MSSFYFITQCLCSRALVNSSSEYLNEVFIYQKKWSKIFQLNETKRKHVRLLDHACLFEQFIMKMHLVCEFIFAVRLFMP